MERITWDSLDALNRRLDAEQVLELLGATHIQRMGPELRAFCPVHGSDHQPSLAVRLADNAVMCHQTGCPAHPGGSLLWLYALKAGYKLPQAAKRWAQTLGISLKYEAHGPLPDTFVYVEHAGQPAHGRFWRNRLVPIHHVSSPTSTPNDEQYLSIFRYNLATMDGLNQALEAEQAFLYGDIYLDFDNPFPCGPSSSLSLAPTPFAAVSSFEEGITRAQVETRNAVHILIQRGVPEEALFVFFSGRGFHLQVDPRALAIPPSTTLHLNYQQLAFHIGGVDPTQAKIPLQVDRATGRPNKQAFPARFQTLDQGIYQPKQLWRRANSINRKSGKYKIALSLDQLRNLNAATLLRKAGRPGTLPRRPRHLSSLPQTRRWFTQIVQQDFKAFSNPSHPIS